MRSLAAALWSLICLPIGISAALLALLHRPLGLRLGGLGTQIWCKGLLPIFNIHITVRGPVPPPGSFAVSNHLSYLDIPVLGSLFRQTFIAKSEIAGWPGLGFMARIAGTLFINREKASDTVRMSEELESLLKEELTITLFAEGTSWRGDSILPFKPSLFETPAQLQVPCVPVTLRYSTPGAGPGAAGPNDGSPHEIVCWWGDAPFGAHFRALTKLPRIEAEVCFGEAVSGIQDRKELAAQLHQRVVQQFVPIPQ